MTRNESTTVETTDRSEELGDIRRTAIGPNFWYQVAKSRDVKAGKAQAVSFAGDPIALIRPRQGKVYALENRCVHCQVPLHILGQRAQPAEGQRDLMTIRTGYPCQTLRFWTAGSKNPALDLWNVYVPLDH